MSEEIKQITGGDTLYMRELNAKLINRLTSTGIFVVDKVCCTKANHGIICDFIPSKDFLPFKNSKL